MVHYVSDYRGYRGHREYTRGRFSVNFRRYARLGNKFVTICTDILAWKMYPLYWNIQKIPPQNAPIFMKCTENPGEYSVNLALPTENNAFNGLFPQIWSPLGSSLLVTNERAFLTVGILEFFVKPCWISENKRLIVSTTFLVISEMMTQCSIAFLFVAYFTQPDIIAWYAERE